MSPRSVRTLASLGALIAMLTVWAGAAPAATAASAGSATVGAAPNQCAGRATFGIMITGKVVAIRQNPSLNARVIGTLRQFAEVNACDPTFNVLYTRCGKRSVTWYRLANRQGFVPEACTTLLFRLANPN
jgi:hypothetical protein